MPNTTTEAGRRFQVLALDGGGLKGIFAAAALARLERDFESPIADHFDLITGTSTGGLIALALASGIPAQEILTFYLDNARTIFPTSRRARLRRGWRPYDVAPLRDCLEKLLGGRTLADSPVRLAIPSFNQTSNEVYLFRTAHLAHLKRDHRERMVDVALATSAAPTFLPAHRLDGLRFIDGGVWANNPSMVGLVEAVVACEQPADSVRLLNVGTTTEVQFRPTKLDTGGLLQWATHATDVILRGQGLAAINHSKLLLGAQNVHRLDVVVPRGLHALDSVNTNDLIGHAAASSRKASPEIAHLFSHTASAYTNFAKDGDA